MDKRTSTADLDRRLTSVVPSERQFSFQQTEFYSFVHFTVNTYTGREWGDGTEPPDIFHPVKMDAAQWVESCRAAGMKGLILTCKHHDGFCLWPSRYTAHTIAYSPYRNGNGDIVKEVADACRKGGLRFGVYLSPWDRNSSLYGQGEPYNDYFVNQLTELLTNYGEVFSVWFDGACGEGQNGKKQNYDWERYYQVIRRLQPNACINVCGPDIRWCGNEAGDTREAEWSVVPKRMQDTEKIAELSQQEDDSSFRERRITAKDGDLGSCEVLQEETELIWYPAEVNTSIRPGWFYHEREDGQVRSLDELMHIYFNSVGGNATFLLNIPPTKEGLFHEMDRKRLYEIGAFLNRAFSCNLLDSGKLSVDHSHPLHNIESVRTDDYDNWFMTEDGVTECAITIEWDTPVEVSYLIMKENILLGQRMEKYTVEVSTLEGDCRVYPGRVIGYKKIMILDGVKTDRIRIRIEDARVSSTLTYIGVY